MKKSVGSRSIVSAALLSMALLGACASPGAHEETTAAKKPFSDPGQFESLASGAFEYAAPAVVAEAAAPVAAATPAEPVAAPRFEADVAPSRSIASVKAEEEISNPDGAYNAIVRGNERFVTGAVKGDHRDSERRRSLASGQKPHTIVLSCSDSRVPPELIFDQGLGDLFTIRVAGNVLGSAQVASIEYAVAHLGAKLILVMGHESCGAVKATLDTKKNASAGSQDLDWLVSTIRPNLSARGLANYDSSTDPKLRKPVMANVDAVSDDLVVRSKLISDAVSKGTVKIVRGIYGLDSGKVDFWGLK